MKYDIVALGEILIDFTPSGKDLSGDAIFARKAGGAPVNLLATVSKYGGSAAFIGKVGNDMFGRFLRDCLADCNISDVGLATDPVHNTTLAFVSLSESGDRDFSFYRRFGADVFLEKSDIDPEIIKNSKIFHFGSLSLTDSPAKEATEYALGIAKRAGCIITYDPNYREPLWDSRRQAVEMMKKHLDKVDILKISKEELAMLFGSGDEKSNADLLISSGMTAVLVTDGPNGASVYTKDGFVSLPAAEAATVDTTAAGDIFFGSFLAQFIGDGAKLSSLTSEKAAVYLKKAIYISGKSTEHYGAIASIPDANIFKGEIL